MSILSTIGSPTKQMHTGRKSTKPDFFSDALDWQIFRAAKVPGPGAYTTRFDYRDMPGGKWSKTEGRAGPGDMAKRAVTPGPGAYDVEGAHKAMISKGGGKFNTSQSKTYLDLAVHSRKGIPGPASYSLPDMNKPGGGKFNMSRSKTDVEWTILRASRLPAPGQYGTGITETPGGGKFNTSKIKTDIDWAVLRASKIPGPGQYDLNGTDGRISGGRFNLGKSKTDVDWAIARGKNMPGPGNYDLSRSDKYLSKNQGFSFASRPGPCNLPFPYAELSYVSANAPPLRGSRSVVTSPEASMVSSRRSFQDIEGAVERSRSKMETQLVRMKTAMDKAAVKRRQRATLGFGRSFFM